MDKVNVLNFSEGVGPIRTLPRNSPPLDYFLQLIANNTSKYAPKVKLDRQEMRGDSIPTLLDEIKAFSGVIILMRIIKLPKIAHYWSTDEQFYQPSIAKVLS